MTFEEKQTLEILEVIIKADFPKPVEFEELSRVLGHIIASAEPAVIDRIVAEGLVFRTRETPHLFGITLPGRNKYKALKKKQRTERYEKIAFWVIFAATVITVYFPVIDNISCNNMPYTKRPQQDKDTSIRQVRPIPIDTPKTTKVHPAGDSLLAD